MAIDWQSLNQRFIRENSRTGISVKAWCKQKTLNYDTARRYIKPRVDCTEPIVRKINSAQNVKSLRKMRFTKSYKQKIQRVSAHESDALANKNFYKNTASKKRVASLGNQNARKHGYYSTFITTGEDIQRYLSASKATLRDELNIVRMQMLNLMCVINRIKADINADDFAVEQKCSLRNLHDRLNTLADIKIARIESLENSLIKQAKMKADIERSIVLTRKVELEIDKLSRELGGNEAPLSEIYDEILAMDGDGMMYH